MNIVVVNDVVVGAGLNNHISSLPLWAYLKKKFHGQYKMFYKFKLKTGATYFKVYMSVLCLPNVTQ